MTDKPAMTDLIDALPCTCGGKIRATGEGYHSLACPAIYRPAVEKLREADEAKIAELMGDVESLKWAGDRVVAAEARAERAEARVDELEQAIQLDAARAEKLAGALRRIAQYGEDHMGYVNAQIDGMSISNFARTALQEAPTCETCDGSGEVENFVPGYDGDGVLVMIEPCPRCKARMVTESA